MAKPLVAELRRRSYEATVTQNGSSLQVVLTEPRFEDWHSEDAGRFTGNITSTGVNFYIGRDRAGWFSLLWERLPDGSTLQIEGSANTTESSGVLSGALAGWFTYLGSKGEPLGECDGSRFTLSRR
jgi:hypothetical protein